MSDGQVKLDFARRARLGLDEAILCAGKSDAQLAHILDQGAARDASLLLTRLEAERFAALPERHRARIDYESLSRTAVFGAVAEPAGPAEVAVVTAGTSDTPVSREAARTLRYHGVACLEVCDVGVAGLWRLLERVEELRAMAVVIVASGMDGALPSVLGGLVPGLVIAVPTSTGYGAADGGRTALNAALASCAPGVLVVNIDNGYGAACAAVRALRRSVPRAARLRPDRSRKP